MIDADPRVVWIVFDRSVDGYEEIIGVFDDQNMADEVCLQINGFYDSDAKVEPFTMYINKNKEAE